MTLQRRLILAVLIAAPVVWLLTIGMTYVRARHEINELYDTDMVRMAMQMHSLVPLVDITAAPSRARLPEIGEATRGMRALATWRLLPGCLTARPCISIRTGTACRERSASRVSPTGASMAIAGGCITWTTTSQGGASASGRSWASATS